MLEFRIPKAQFDEMVSQGKIVVDGLERSSFQVLPQYLDELNAATSGTRRWIEQVGDEFVRLFGP